MLESLCIVRTNDELLMNTPTLAAQVFELIRLVIYDVGPQR